MGKQQEDIGLNDDRKKQLDGNIKNMISSGASNEDVAKYAMDFKSNFAVKKNDSPQGLQNTSTNGQPLSNNVGIPDLNSLANGNRQAVPTPLTTKGSDEYLQQQLQPKVRQTQPTLGRDYLGNKKGESKIQQGIAEQFLPNAPKDLSVNQFNPDLEGIGAPILPDNQELNKKDALHKEREEKVNYQTSKDIEKYQAVYKEAQGTPLADAVKNIPFSESTIKQGENSPYLTDKNDSFSKQASDFASRQLDGVGYILGGLTKGVSNIIKSTNYIGNKLSLNPSIEPTLDDANKKVDTFLEPITTSKQTESRYNETKVVSQLHGLAEFTVAALASEATGGASFFLNGIGGAVDEVAKMKKEGVEFNNHSDDFYIVGTGILDYFLMKRLNSHTLLSKFPSTLRDNIVKKLSMEAIGDIAKQGEKVTAESVLNTFKEKALGFDAKLKQMGVDYVKSYAYTAVDLTALSVGKFGLGKATNSLSGKNIFKQTPEELMSSVGKILTIEAPIFAGLGPAKQIVTGQLFKKSPYRNEVVESLYKDATPENVDAIKNDLATHLQEKGLSEQEIANSVNYVDKLSEVTRTLPKTLSKEKFSEGVDLIVGRQELKDQLSQIKESKQSLDESIRDIPTKEEDLVQAKLEQSNDKLQELATGDKYKYNEDLEKGTYTKELGNGKPQEISKDRYELEQLEKQFKTQKNEKANNEKTSSQETSSENANEENVNVEDGKLQSRQNDGFQDEAERGQQKGENDGQNDVQRNEVAPIETNISSEKPADVSKLIEEKDGKDMWKMTQSESFAKYEDKETGKGLTTHQRMANNAIKRAGKGTEGSTIEGKKLVYRNSEGEPVGYLMFYDKGISEIGILKEYQGKGIASKMVDYLKENKGIDNILPPFSEEGNLLSHRNEVKKAIENGSYDKAIKDGTLTQEKVDEIIKSAGLDKNIKPKSNEKTNETNGQELLDGIPKEGNKDKGGQSGKQLRQENKVSNSVARDVDNKNYPDLQKSINDATKKEDDLTDQLENHYKRKGVSQDNIDKLLVYGNKINDFKESEPEAYSEYDPSVKELHDQSELATNERVALEDKVKNKLITDISDSFEKFGVKSSAIDKVKKYFDNILTYGTFENFGKILKSNKFNTLKKDLVLETYKEISPDKFRGVDKYEDIPENIRKKVEDKVDEAMSDFKENFITQSIPTQEVKTNEQGTTVKETKETAQPIIKPTEGEKAIGKEDAKVVEPVTKLQTEKEKSSLSVEEQQRKKELRIKLGLFKINSLFDPTKITSKDFREYAGLLLKEAIGDFKAWSNEMVDTFGDAVKEHLPKLFKDLNDEANGGNKLKEDDFLEQPTENKFTKKLSDDIASADVSKSMSNIAEFSDREVGKDQLEYNAVTNEVAIKHGRDIIDAAKEEFGDSYVNNVLDYVENNKMANDTKALTLISLENDLHKRLLEEPQNEIKLSKQLKKVENATIKHLRESARGTQYGIFRQISRVGYDVDQVTSSMFTKEQSKSKDKIKQKVEGVTPEEIQKQAEEKEQKNEFEDVVLKKPTGTKLKEAQLGLQKAKEDFRKAIRRSMNQSNSTGPFNIIGEATNLMRAYAKLGIVKIEDILKEVSKDFGEKFVKNNDEVLREAHKEANKPKTKEELTPEELLQKAKDSIKERIKEKEQHIADKEVELKIRGKKFTEDAEYKSLKRELSELSKLEQQYLTPDSKTLLDERKKNTVVTKLENEIADLDKQIASEQKIAVEKKQPLTNDKIEALKADKKARVEFLEQVDPNTKDFVKQALIDAGYSKEINVTRNGVKERRSILDWNQLSTDGISTIRDVVTKTLENNKDLSEAKKNLMINQLENEYISLQADIIEKGINELNRGNEVKNNTSSKSQATRLAELYNKGLFNHFKNSDTYDYLINKTFGTSIKDQEIFFKIKDLLEVLSLSQEFKANGERLSDISKSTLSQQVKEQIKDLLQLAVARQAAGEGFAGKAFLASEIAKQLMGSSQRQLLVSLKQAVENPVSNYINDVDVKLQDLFKKGKWDTKELSQARVLMAKTIFNDTLLHGGTEYGGTGNAFVSKNAIEDWVSNLSKNEMYQAVINVASGKPFLDSADSAFKIKRTELEFTHNLLRILTDKSSKNQMTQDEALAYVSESLTGQSLDNATKIANDLIDHVNSTIGRQILSNRETNVRRIANDIMKDGLVNGGKLTIDEVKAAFDAAYVTAGAGIGHEANNVVSKSVSLINRYLQGELDKAVKEKEWGTAAMYNGLLVLQRNFLTPFVGGGTNWTIIGLQRIGVPMQFTNPDVYKNKTIDLSTTDGMNKLSKTLERKATLQRANSRWLIGVSAQLATLAAAGVIFSTSNKGQEDKEKIMKWMKDHPQLTKYSRVVAPFALQMYFSKDDNEQMKAILSAIGSRYGYQDDGEKLIKNTKIYYDAIANNNENNKEKALGAFGEFLGGKLNIPYAPTRLYKNLTDLASEIKGQKIPYIKSRGFMSGFMKNGIGDVFGWRDAGGSADILLSLDNKSLELMKSKNYELKSKDWGDMKINDPKLGKERIVTKPERDVWNKEYNDFMATYLSEQSEDLKVLKDDDFKEKMSQAKQYANGYAKYKSTGEVGNILQYTIDGITHETTKEERETIMIVYDKKVNRAIHSIGRKTREYVKKHSIPYELAYKIQEVNLRKGALEEAKTKVLKE